MTATTANEPASESAPWWMVLIEGVALIILGLLLLANPAKTGVIIVQVLGIYWFIAGILSIVRIFIDSSAWGLKLIAGIIGIIAGILVLQHPLTSTLLVGNATITVLGIGGIIIGAVNIYNAFKGAGWGTGILGAISIIMGIVLLANIWIFTFSLPWVIGILSVIGGIIALFGAFRMRSEGSQAQATVPETAVTEETEAEPAAPESAAKEAVAKEVVAQEAVVLVAPPAAVAAAAVAVAAEEDAEAPEEEIAAEAESDEGEEAEADSTPAAAPEIPDTPGEKAKYAHDMSFVEGIGPAYAQTLAEAGIENPLELLEKGATRKGRAELSDQTGISRKLILKWVNQVDLYRVPGIGSQYADLLEAAGVDTVPELAQRNPGNLHKKMVEVNDEKNLVRQAPAESQVEKWVTEAKALPRKITY